MKPLLVGCFVLSLSLAPPPSAQSAGDLDARTPLFEVPDLRALAAVGMDRVIERYSTDARTLERFYDARFSQSRRAHLRELAEAWSSALLELDFEAMGEGERVDYLLFEGRLNHQLRRLDIEEAERAEVLPLIPFGDTICDLQEARRRLEPVVPAEVAARVVGLTKQIEELTERVVDEDATDTDEGAIVASAIIANRAAREVGGLRNTLASWYSFSAGYDPLFNWWVEEPYRELREALEDYADFLREDIAGLEEDDDDTILGDPIGREALLVELEKEWIPYTPAELLEIAEAEFAWCDAEMDRATEELGFDDWRAAQDSVKEKHVDPGDQPEMIRRLAFEAVDFLEERELLTIPALAKNSWRMEMMSPERQRFTPYFTGGEVISVAYPTGAMSHEEKRMTMRGNNEHFSRATVHHELIPGHHLQQFVNARNQTHRRVFSTPFWIEGWAVYWEMLLWDLGFPRSPEDRIGMLFWRKHRCARILFSLNFHLGEWSPEECIDFLVERVGHERKNATAEVRRSVQGGYGPLYQAAYMLGALQFRALHRDLVQSGAMTNRAFHDAVLAENSIPVELLRAILIDAELARDTRSGWRFYDD